MSVMIGDSSKYKRPSLLSGVIGYALMLAGACLIVASFFFTNEEVREFRNAVWNAVFGG